MNSLSSIDLSPLCQCLQLQYLSVGQNQIEEVDLTPLSSLASLEIIGLTDNRLSHIDLSPLVTCHSLRALRMSGNKLQAIDLSPLALCESLEELDLRYNRLKTIDLWPLASSGSVRRVSLFWNELECVDMTPIVFLPNLEGLGLRRNNQLRLVTLLGAETVERNSPVIGQVRSDQCSFDVPVYYNGLKPIMDLVPLVEQHEPSWKSLHLSQCISKTVGLESLGFLDIDPQSIICSPDITGMRGAIIEKVCRQIDQGVTTTRMDITQAASIHPEISSRMPRVLELRREEMENMSLFTDDATVGLRPLWLTAYGFLVLSSLGLGLECTKDEFVEVSGSFNKIGFVVRLTENHALVGPSEMSQSFQEYIWVLAEYIEKKGIM